MAEVKLHSVLPALIIEHGRPHDQAQMRLMQLAARGAKAEEYIPKIEIKRSIISAQIPTVKHFEAWRACSVI